MGETPPITFGGDFNVEEISISESMFCTTDFQEVGGGGLQGSRHEFEGGSQCNGRWVGGQYSKKN